MKMWRHILGMQGLMTLYMRTSFESTVALTAADISVEEEIKIVTNSTKNVNYKRK